MDLDKAFVASILKEGRPALISAVEKGIGESHIFGEGKIAYDFIRDYNSNYGAVPTVEIVQGKLGIELVDQGGAAGFFTEEIINRKLHSDLTEGIKLSIAELEAREPRKCLAKLEELIYEIRKANIGEARTKSLLAMGEEVLALHDRMKNGERGVPFPWPSIDDVTMGMWPEDLIILVARTGVGKTWATICITEHAWTAGKRVLFATTEISDIRIAMRFFSYKYKIPYDDLRRGRMSDFQRERFEEELKKVQNKDGLFVVGGGFDFTVESFAAAIDDTKPDLVIMDGAYLLKVPGANRIEQAANGMNELKRIAKRKKVPVVITTQLNRDAKKNSGTTIKVENIALTDVAGWNADLILGLLQTEDMRRDKRAMIMPLKVRDGVPRDVELNWDFDTMNFSELPQAGSGAAKSSGNSDAEDPFGAGSDPFASSSGEDVPF